MLVLLFNGLAYGVLLFLMAAGLSVTMGLMGFANLAHTAFAMLGAYFTVTLMERLGWPFLGAVPAAVIVTAIVAATSERLIFRHVYGAGQLRQVLLTLGIVFMVVTGVTYVWGSSQQPVHLPAYLTGSIRAGGIDLSTYRVLLIGLGSMLVAALLLGVERTSFGAKIRAAVDNRRMTESCGIDVDRLFAITFAVGSALAALGGALSADLVGLNPGFATSNLVYVLIVVVVGGLGSLRGTLAAALGLGIADVLGKYFVPELGAFIIYAITAGVLLWRPQGLFARA